MWEEFMLTRFICLYVYLFIYGLTGWSSTFYVDQADLKLIADQASFKYREICLPLLPKWQERHEPPHPAQDF